jgi:phage-related protein
MNKVLVWLHGEVKTPPFSKEARLEAGFLLRRLQQGEKIGMPLSRPMPTVARGCHELRIGDEQKTWRIMYAVEPDAIVILEVFAKKSEKTPKAVLDVCRERLKRYRTDTRGQR